MRDLIDRQAAIEYLMTNMCWYNEDGYEETEDEKRNAITDLINALPPAQPERKRGQWVEIGDEPYDEWECDVCGFVIDGSGCIDPEEYKDVYRFCPNCGADMRQEEGSDGNRFNNP